MNNKLPSDRSIATALGVSLSSWQEARDSGRATVILDPSGGLDVTAMKELWAANTRAQGPNPLSERGNAPAASQPASTGTGESRADALRRRAIADANLKEIELARIAGELMPAKEAEGRIADLVVAFKTKLLGIPSRILQADPSFTTAQLALVKSLIREALEERIELDEQPEAQS